MALSPQQVLRLWHKMMVSGLHAGLPDLTARQLALLLHVYLEPMPHTVRGLAEKLQMSKPAVTRALDRLCGLDYLRRKTDEADRRSILVQRTVKGSVFLRNFADVGVEYTEDLMEKGEAF